MGLIAEPIEHVVIEPDCDPSLSGRNRHDGSTPSLTEIVFPFGNGGAALSRSASEL
jgi:hypothetical protein